MLETTEHTFLNRQVQKAQLSHRTLFSERMKCRTSPCFMYGKTTRGSPSFGSIMPSRDRMLGWWKLFMMRPSLRNWSTSLKSVIPVTMRQTVTHSSNSHKLILCWFWVEDGCLHTVQWFNSTVGLLFVLVYQVPVINCPKVACMAWKHCCN